MQALVTRFYSFLLNALLALKDRSAFSSRLLLGSVQIFSLQDIQDALLYVSNPRSEALDGPH